MSAHTPGPWRLEEVRGTFEDAARIVGADGEKVVCVCADDTMEIDDGAIAEVLSPTAKANARLIAAAPDLYAALHRLVKASGQIGLLDNHVEDARREAINALAKAVGP